MATREERMRDRMRGAGRHNVGDIDFGFIIPVAEEPADNAEELPADEPSAIPGPAPTTRPSPNASAKRRRLDLNSVAQPKVHTTTEHDVYSLPDHSTEAGETIPASPSTLPSQSPAPQDRETEPENENHPMADAAPLPPTAATAISSAHPRHQRGPLSSVISATKRLSFEPPSSSSTSRRRGRTQDLPLPLPPPEEMEVTESPADAPGSGRRRLLRTGAGTPVVGSSALLQKVLAAEEGVDGGGDGDGDADAVGNSSPIERRMATRRSAGASRRVRAGAGIVAGRRAPGRMSGSSVAESEMVMVEEKEEEIVMHEEVVQADEGQDVGVEQAAEQEEPEEEERAEEIEEEGEEEAAQRLGRKRPRRSQPAPSPELGSGATEESPAPKRRRRRKVISPAQQQQPSKRPRGRLSVRAQPQPQPQPSPEPPLQRQPKAKPKPRRQVKKHRGADDDETEKPTGSVPVTVQRFTKPSRGSKAEETEDEQSADLNSDIPFADRGGVNAIDVLSKLCEELIEAYMEKLEERARAAEDAATRREQKTMYRALEAFQEELRTRLLEHTIALDTLHALRKRVRAAQKEKLTLRDNILRIRAEREQVALRMDAIRIRHEADSKEALVRSFREIFADGWLTGL
ncbi:hypothetical protein N657DRAFT_639178 [Parathielavia appendiculata]|uniref:Inner kinetochore subunit AME1 domain-containing protein n=1 Tax=Parathielavia appendiculata TaxID=2587402 RepID=A0AAN6U9F4_9PEZI|nr:hypothetical protein N657DRAFT_639178 [Parathielavia appendiculata]